MTTHTQRTCHIRVREDRPLPVSLKALRLLNARQHAQVKVDNRRILIMHKGMQQADGRTGERALDMQAKQIAKKLGWMALAIQLANRPDGMGCQKGVYDLLPDCMSGDPYTYEFLAYKTQASCTIRHD